MRGEGGKVQNIGGDQGGEELLTGCELSEPPPRPQSVPNNCISHIEN